jgi:hypothetical protein
MQPLSRALWQREPDVHWSQVSLLLPYLAPQPLQTNLSLLGLIMGQDQIGSLFPSIPLSSTSPPVADQNPSLTIVWLTPSYTSRS